MKIQWRQGLFVLLTSCLLGATPLLADEVNTSTPAPATTSDTTSPEETMQDVTKKVTDTAEEAAKYATEKTEEIAEIVDKNEQAKEYSAGILQPIYAMAEYMSFSSFHWIAFMVMVSGVVSFALQLVLAKLAVLAHGGFSLKQILVDSQGLIISLVGLFLTTQAATQNSSFTSSPAAVLSSTIVGAVLGFVFYLWSQSEELEAVRYRKVQQKAELQQKKKK
ncbi:MAG: hypothetical protein KDA78_17900 [Planctomycetaceae bacterium]|nr:hypothetical protein [Planctomycetaceae bacterium]